MKYSISFLTIFVLTVITASCGKSFLDVPVTREVVAEDYIADLTSANELLNGIYFLVARDIYEGTITTYADVAADNIKDLGNLLPIQYNWAMKASSRDDYATNMNGLWLDGYNVIRSCNFLIEHIDELRSESPSLADAIKGQAYALRALVHFNLVNIFAQPYSYSANATHPGIPYDTIYAQTQQITRQSVGHVYDHIILDLNRASQLIPGSLNNKAAFNEMAIKAFLARVYLFKEDLGAANHLAVEVALRAPVMLNEDYPDKLFTPGDNESLFWLPPATPTTSGFTFFQGAYFAQSNYFSATTDLADIIRERPNDSRNKWIEDTAGIRQVRKFPVNAIPGIINPRIAYYQTVIRSSEVYLTASETFARLGNEDSARYYLDVIRRRADRTATASTAGGASLLDSIYKERRKEMCFENLRMFDLLRLRKPVSRRDVNSPTPAILPFPSNYAIAPIPVTDAQEYGLQQNSGY